MGNAIQEIETASPSVLREGNGLAASLRKLKRIYNTLFGGVVESVIDWESQFYMFQSAPPRLSGSARFAVFATTPVTRSEA